jgi:hypothetical protein
MKKNPKLTALDYCYGYYKGDDPVFHMVEKGLTKSKAMSEVCLNDSSYHWHGVHDMDFRWKKYRPEFDEDYNLRHAA